MSYEGYEMWLCAKGHLHYFDCHDTPIEKTWRCHCGAAYAWSCDIDQTNGPGEEPELKVAAPAVIETCACCGTSRRTAEETYVIPETKR